MPSQTEIFNLALTKLGQSRAVSPDDDTEPVRVLRAIWEMTRDFALADHPWRFAIKRDSLAAQAEAPAYGWARQFEMPANALRIVQIGDDWMFYQADTARFELEGRMVLTDEAAPLRVRYVQRVTNTGEWPAQFARAVAMLLAADACEKLVQSQSKQNAAREEYIATIERAKQTNAIERPPQRDNYSSWLASRGD